MRTPLEEAPCRQRPLCSPPHSEEVASRAVAAPLPLVTVAPMLPPAACAAGIHIAVLSTASLDFEASFRRQVSRRPSAVASDQSALSSHGFLLPLWPSATQLRGFAPAGLICCCGDPAPGRTHLRGHRRAADHRRNDVKELYRGTFSSVSIGFPSAARTQCMDRANSWPTGQRRSFATRVGNVFPNHETDPPGSNTAFHSRGESWIPTTAVGLE